VGGSGAEEEREEVMATLGWLVGIVVVIATLFGWRDD
jgi:preprotein translocase subunit SecF